MNKPQNNPPKLVFNSLVKKWLIARHFISNVCDYNFKNIIIDITHNERQLLTFFLTKKI